MSDISLSASQRSALLNLQDTTALSNRTTLRLSTGRSVNTVSDGAVNFFRSRALNNRASDLSDRKTDISQGISQLNTSLEALDSIDSFLKQLRGVIESTRSDNTVAGRRAAGAQFASIIGQIGSLVSDASFQGLNLLNSTGSSLAVSFSERSASRLVVNGINLVATGNNNIFGVANVFSKVTFAFGGTGNQTFSGIISALVVSTVAPPARNIGSTAAGGLSFTNIGRNNSNIAGVNGLVSRIDAAIAGVRSQSQILGSNAAILQTRLDFTNRYVNRLRSGGDQLVLADLNEEGANLLALQTRQQLGINSLSLASQQQSAILQLIR